jgi:hypothetical protein
VQFCSSSGVFINTIGETPYLGEKTLSSKSLDRWWRFRFSSARFNRDGPGISHRRQLICSALDPLVTTDVLERNPRVHGQPGTRRTSTSDTQLPGAKRPGLDLQTHLAELKANGLLVRIDHPFNKDTELHPLVRCQFSAAFTIGTHSPWHNSSSNR